MSILLMFLLAAPAPQVADTGVVAGVQLSVEAVRDRLGDASLYAVVPVAVLDSLSLNPILGSLGENRTLNSANFRLGTRLGDSTSVLDCDRGRCQVRDDQVILIRVLSIAKTGDSLMTRVSVSWEMPLLFIDGKKISGTLTTRTWQVRAFADNGRYRIEAVRPEICPPGTPERDCKLPSRWSE